MIGQTLSHYKILEKIGEGGMGVVYKAHDTRLLRYVAIKILAAHVMGDEERRNRFMREAQTASSLNHPNICTIHDIDESNGVHFIVIELIEGETLREVLQRRSYLPKDEIIDIAIKVCDALSTVHTKGIFHRDIRPDNIMLSREGYVKVMDFSLAKLAVEAAEAIAGSKIGEFADDRAESWQESYLENVAAMKRPHELDPLPFYSNLRLGHSYFVARRYDEAIAQLRKTEELFHRSRGRIGF